MSFNFPFSSEKKLDVIRLIHGSNLSFFSKRGIHEVDIQTQEVVLSCFQKLASLYEELLGEDILITGFTDQGIKTEGGEMFHQLLDDEQKKLAEELQAKIRVVLTRSASS